MSACAACGTSLADAARFCFSCGAPVGAGCVACGVELPQAARFCPACGTAQDADVRPPGSAAVPVSARRITSVLFGDLVGFTSLSEQRDQEDVRATAAATSASANG